MQRSRCVKSRSSWHMALLSFAFQKLPAQIVYSSLQNTIFYAIALRPLFPSLLWYYATIRLPVHISIDYRVLSFVNTALLPFASGQGSCRVSRFPRKELPHMPGFSDSAEPFVPRLDRYVRCCFPLR